MADDLETWIELVGLRGTTEFTKTREPSSEATAVAREIMADDKENPWYATIALAVCLQHCSHDGAFDEALASACTMLRRLCSADTTVLEEFLPAGLAGEQVPLGHSWALCRFALERASAFHDESAHLDTLAGDLDEAKVDLRNRRTVPSREVIELARAIIPDRMANYPWNTVAAEVLTICLQQHWQTASVEQTLSDAAGLLDRLCSASLCMKQPLLSGKTSGELRAVCELARARLAAWTSLPARATAGGLACGASNTAIY